MKFIYITCNVSMLETVTVLLQNKKIANYQVIEKVAAVSSFDEPRQDTAVWPGYNSALLVQEADEERARELMKIFFSSYPSSMSFFIRVVFPAPKNPEKISTYSYPAFSVCS